MARLIFPIKLNPNVLFPSCFGWLGLLQSVALSSTLGNLGLLLLLLLLYKCIYDKIGSFDCCHSNERPVRSQTSQHLGLFCSLVASDFIPLPTTYRYAYPKLIHRKFGV